MAWLTTLVGVIGLAILLAPVAMLLLTVFVLVPLAHLVPRPPMLGRVTFTCPFSRRIVTVAFLSPAGADHPSDVAACSLYGDGPVRCKKGCVDLATTGWAASAMTPRFSLVADGVALRDVARTNGAETRVGA
jgi:hypothetical protein